MIRRQLGRNGPEVSAVGLGCMGMSEFYGPAEDAKSIDVIHRALEIGVTFLDTSDMYGVGRNESLIGRALQGRRDRAVLATKFAVLRGDDGSYRGISGKPEHVQQACDASLARLGIDTIDLYYQHRVDRSVPIEDTVGAMAALVAQGKVRHLGLCECSPETLRRAHATHPIAAVQTELSLWSRDAETEILGVCRELGIAFVSYSPLGRGFLTGAIKSVADLDEKDFRRSNPRFQPGNFEKNLALVAKVEELAAAKSVTPSQLALAWVLSRGEHVVAIPGTRSRARLEENAAATDVKLTADELGILESVFPLGAAAGGRYSDQGMRSVNG